MEPPEKSQGADSPEKSQGTDSSEKFLWSEFMARFCYDPDEARRREHASKIRERHKHVQVLRQIEASAEPVLLQSPQLRQYLEYCIGLWIWRSHLVESLGGNVVDDTRPNCGMFGDREFDAYLSSQKASADRIVSKLQTALEHEGSGLQEEKVRAVARFCVDTVLFSKIYGFRRYDFLVKKPPSPDVHELCKPYLG